MVASEAPGVVTDTVGMQDAGGPAGDDKDSKCIVLEKAFSV